MAWADDGMFVDGQYPANIGTRYSLSSVQIALFSAEPPEAAFLFTERLCVLQWG